MSQKFTISQFIRRFPNETACLEEIRQLCWPDGITCTKCNQVTPHYKITTRPAYACQNCGKHVYPLAGTIFEKSTTPLQLWFYAIYLMAQTRAGISAKQLQRELGVTYKTAWRMFKQIRTLMADTSQMPLSGTVEIDETYIGGKARRSEWGPDKPKQIVMGMVERGGKAYLKHVPNTGKWTLLNQIRANVSPYARVFTDENPGYTHLPKFGYAHQSVNHQTEYVRGEVHVQNMEGVWSHLKRGIKGVYRFVSKKYLQAYADEYAFRYNHRRESSRMFDLILNQVPQVRSVQASRLA